MPSQQEFDMLISEARYEIKKRDVEIERLRATLLQIEDVGRNGILTDYSARGHVRCQKIAREAMQKSDEQ